MLAGDGQYHCVGITHGSIGLLCNYNGVAIGRGYKEDCNAHLIMVSLFSCKACSR